MPEILTMKSIAKRFGNTLALRGVNLSVAEGSVHALVGENGAGKSTLMKILSGAHSPDAGSMTLLGKPFRPLGPAHAKQFEVAMVYQELTLAPQLTVAQNLVLGMESTRWGVLRSMKKEVQSVLDQLEGVDLDPDAKVEGLGIGSQQMVEIGRALLQKARLLILDEPTSGLSHREVEILFRLIAKLKVKGVSLVYISHFLEEVMELSDDYTVLRDGQTVASGKTAEVSMDILIGRMIGREVKELYPVADAALGSPKFSFRVDRARGLKTPIELELRQGEILGLAGLVGSGRSELLKSLVGLHREVSGEVRRLTEAGETHASLEKMYPSKAFKMGYGLLSEDRKGEGLALQLSIGDNLTLPTLKRFVKGIHLSKTLRRKEVELWIERLEVKAASAEAPIDSLSGGNQQKVAMGRLLHQDLELLLLDEPTRGVDVGSKAQIYALIHAMAAKGGAVLVVSSYLPELFGICSHLQVMHRGKISEKKAASEWSAESVMAYATTGKPFLDREMAFSRLRRG